jgi:hypothetical protein
MKTVEIPSYPVSIFIAGDRWHAESICRRYCDETGFCVTVTATEYVYTDGEEDGVIVGLINYPRFPAKPAEIWSRAEELAKTLRQELEQDSFTIQAPDKTAWFSWRAENLASADTHPKDGDVQQAPLVSGTVPEGQTPNV